MTEELLQKLRMHDLIEDTYGKVSNLPYIIDSVKSTVFDHPQIIFLGVNKEKLLKAIGVRLMKDSINRATKELIFRECSTVIDILSKNEEHFLANNFDMMVNFKYESLIDFVPELLTIESLIEGDRILDQEKMNLYGVNSYNSYQISINGDSYLDDSYKLVLDLVLYYFTKKSTETVESMLNDIEEKPLGELTGAFRGLYRLG